MANKIKYVQGRVSESEQNFLNSKIKNHFFSPKTFLWQVAEIALFCSQKDSLFLHQKIYDNQLLPAAAGVSYRDGCTAAQHLCLVTLNFLEENSRRKAKMLLMRQGDHDADNR